jgi:hypothetical protein
VSKHPGLRLGGLALLVFAAATCADESDPTSQESNETESREVYDFQLPEEGDELVRVDAVGVALVSTVLMNRDRTATGRDNENRYQAATPDVQNQPSTLVGFIHYLRSLHKYWHDDLVRQGFEPCSKKVLGQILATPCTTQNLRFDEDASIEGPRVMDTVLPDYITLDLDQPLRFPNGRTPWEPISDKVFALGFLEMGGKCPGIDDLPEVSEETLARIPRDEDGVPICTVETLANIPLQVAANDRPFEGEFPYLARPWFYEEPEEATSYYWPEGARLELPE